MADLLRRVTTRSRLRSARFRALRLWRRGPDPRLSVRRHGRHLDRGGADDRLGPFGARRGDRGSPSLVLARLRRARAAALQEGVRPRRCRRVQRWRSQKLEAQCRAALGDSARIERKVGMRFRQQVHEIEIDVPAKALQAADVDALVDRFEETYERIYGKGTALRMSGVEFTVLRTEAISPVRQAAPGAAAQDKREGGAAARRARSTSTASVSATPRSTARRRWGPARPSLVPPSSSGPTRQSWSDPASGSRSSLTAT